jgi:hypothetical protein
VLTPTTLAHPLLQTAQEKEEEDLQDPCTWRLLCPSDRASAALLAHPMVRNMSEQLASRHDMLQSYKQEVAALRAQLRLATAKADSLTVSAGWLAGWLAAGAAAAAAAAAHAWLDQSAVLRRHCFSACCTLHVPRCRCPTPAACSLVCILASLLTRH